MLSYRLGTVNDFHWEFKSVLSYSKPYTFSTFFGEEKGRKNALTQMFEIAISLHYILSLARIWPRKILLSEPVISSYHKCQMFNYRNARPTINVVFILLHFSILHLY